MKRIFKYQLETTDKQVIHMPRGAWPLCVQVQVGPCLWAMVDDSQPPEPRTVRVIGTGHPIPDADRLGYVGTYQLNGGALVFHVFLAPPDGVQGMTLAADANDEDPHVMSALNAGVPRYLCNKCGRWAEPVSQEDEATVTEFALRSACGHLGTLVDRQREVLRAARTMIQEHREELVRGHFDPKTGSVDEDGQRGLDEYDAVLAQIDALLPESVIPHDPTRTP